MGLAEQHPYLHAQAFLSTTTYPDIFSKRHLLSLHMSRLLSIGASSCFFIEPVEIGGVCRFRTYFFNYSGWYHTAKPCASTELMRVPESQIWVLSTVLWLRSKTSGLVVDQDFCY